MASMWRKAMLYLGLGPDEEYDDYEIADEHQRPVPPHQPVRRTAPAGPPRDRDATGSVRTLTPSMGEGERNGGANGTNGVGREASHQFPTRSASAVADRTVAPRHRPSVVRPLVAGHTSKPHVIGPTSFDDAQEVADKFKVNVPVILNLQGVDRDLSRRIIDFASGLCYGLGGQMERVANQVYLLTPSDVEVSAEERRRLQERGYEA